MTFYLCSFCIRFLPLLSSFPLILANPESKIDGTKKGQNRSKEETERNTKNEKIMKDRIGAHRGLPFSALHGPRQRGSGAWRLARPHGPGAQVWRRKMKTLGNTYLNSSKDATSNKKLYPDLSLQNFSLFLQNTVDPYFQSQFHCSPAALPLEVHRPC